MATEYINPQWRLPNEKTGNDQGYCMVNSTRSQHVKVSGLATSLNLTDEVSISIWWRTPSQQSNKYIFGFQGPGTNNGFDLGMHGSNIGSYAAFSGSGSGGLLTSFNYYDNVWHNYILTYSGSVRKFYIDGDLIVESSASGNILLNSSGDFFTFSTNSGNFGGIGEASDVCIFDYALSDGGISAGSTATGQVADLYASTNPMALANPPQVYYPLGNSTHTGSNYLTPNAAIQDYVFNGGLSSNYGFNSSINQSNTGGKFTVSFWAKNATNQQVSFNHGAASYTGAFQQVSGKMIVWLAASVYQYFIYPTPDPRNDGKWHHYVVYVDTNTTTDSEVWIDKVQMTKGSGGNGTINAFTSGFVFKPFTGDVSNMMYFTNYEIDQANVDKLYNYGSPLMSTATLTQAPNAWYKLDASEVYDPTIAEWKVNQATAEYSGSISLPNAQSQTTSEYIQVSNYAGTSGLTSASYSFWYYTVNTNSTLGGWISGGVLNWSGYPFGQGGVGGNQIFQLYTSDGTQETLAPGPASRYLLSNSARALNVWVNVVLTYDGSDPVGGKNGSIRAYVNGVQQAIDPNASPQAAPNDYRNEFPAQGTINTGSLIFGTSNTGNSRSVNAQFSNFAAWNKALSQSEITEIVNGGQPKDLSTHSASSNLVSWWKFDNKTTGLVDSIGGINATIVGSNSDVSPGSVSQLNGTSSGMTQASLVQSDLSFTSGYSPYALQLDGTSNFIDCGATVQQPTTNYSVSCWVKLDSLVLSGLVGNFKTGSTPQVGFALTLSSGLNFQFWADGSANSNGGTVTGTSTPNSSTWYNVVGTYDGSLVKIYVNNVLENSVSYSATPNATDQNLVIGRWYGNYSDYYTAGSMSNVSVWNAALTPAQVTEIYNEGLPSNLNNHSAYSNLVSWWQLGSNSSFTSPDWTCLDEIGSSNGISSNMIENRIVNGVGSSSNGVSTNMGLANNISGSSPNGEANGLSVNMTLANITGGVN